MKKTTVVLIGLIYVMSIVVVGILGLQYQQFHQIIPVESVTVTNPTDKQYDYDGKKIKRYDISMDPTTERRQFQISWEVEPVNKATNNKVKFVYESSICSVNQDTGLVEFSGRGFAIIEVAAQDGSGCSDTIIIFCRN